MKSCQEPQGPKSPATWRCFEGNKSNLDLGLIRDGISFWMFVSSCFTYHICKYIGYLFDTFILFMVYTIPYVTLCHSRAVEIKHVLYNSHVMAMILLGLTRNLKSAPSHSSAMLLCIVWTMILLHTPCSQNPIFLAPNDKRSTEYIDMLFCYVAAIITWSYKVWRITPTSYNPFSK